VAASAPGKLILFGEHAVVFGEPALSTAINLRTEVYARPHNEWLVDGASLDEPKYRYVKAAIARAGPSAPLWLEIRSMIPVGTGLGSSAAVTVATLGAVRSLVGAIDVPAIARQAFEIEHEVQGRASPIDTTTAAAGGGVLVGRGAGPDLLWSLRKDTREWSLHRCVLPGLTFVIGDTGIAAPTGPLVAKVQERVEASPRDAERIREIGRITLDGLQALQKNDLESAGRLMDRNQRLLNDLGVGHPMLDKLVEVARPHSYGVKLTGAGGGGSIVALTDQPDKTANAIRSAGGKAFLVTSEPVGLQRLR
jgi:mevalonate kinase